MQRKNKKAENTQGRRIRSGRDAAIYTRSTRVRSRDTSAAIARSNTICPIEKPRHARSSSRERHERGHACKHERTHTARSNEQPSSRGTADSTTETCQHTQKDNGRKKRKKGGKGGCKGKGRGDRSETTHRGKASRTAPLYESQNATPPCPRLRSISSYRLQNGKGTKKIRK